MTGELQTRLAELPDELPVPGSGCTTSRFTALWDLASSDPSLGRLAEAHYDGAAILREAGRPLATGARFGVWAANGPDPATLTRDGIRWRLTGAKHWCSGASIVSHALLTARFEESNALVLVDMRHRGVRLCGPTWSSPAFAAIDTRTVAFDDAPIENDAIVGEGDWYLHRSGFWHGAVGVAACWAGSAHGLVERLRPNWPSNDHAISHLGAIDAALWAMAAAVTTAANEIDAASDEAIDDRRRRALRVRHVVDVLVADVTTRRDTRGRSSAAGVPARPPPRPGRNRPLSPSVPRRTGPRRPRAHHNRRRSRRSIGHAPVIGAVAGGRLVLG